jgi:PDZ domain
MSAPRHLWSGDWRRESAIAAEELAKRRTRAEWPAERQVDLHSPESRRSPVARRPRARSRRAARVPVARRPRARSRGAARLPVALLLACLLSAGAAYAAVSFAVGSGRPNPASANAAPGWLGIDTISSPLSVGSAGLESGAIVASVAAGSPAAQAGLEPLDVITHIDNHPIATPTDVRAALAGLRAGEQVQIQYDRGPIMYTTQVTLAARPSASP